MLTEFGQALRIIRVQRQLLLKDMADALGVTSAYLSAVETGRRRIPRDWVSKIVSHYSLNHEEAERLQLAAANSATEITITLDGVSPLKKDTVLSFARALDGLSDEELTKIMTIMKEKSKKHGKKQSR